MSAIIANFLFPIHFVTYTANDMSMYYIAQYFAVFIVCFAKCEAKTRVKSAVIYDDYYQSSLTKFKEAVNETTSLQIEMIEYYDSDLTHIVGALQLRQQNVR